MSGLLKRLFGRGDDDGFSDEEIAVMLESLQADDAMERVQAAQLLAEAVDPRAIPGLIAALRADFADRFAQQMRDRDAPTDYKAMHLYTEAMRAQADLRQAAAAALGAIGAAHPDHADAMIPALAAALDDRDYYVSVAARYALEDIGTEAALAVLEDRRGAR